MSTFIAWPSIENAAGLGRFGGLVLRGKTKLHGTNAAVRIDRDGAVHFQSRTRDITPEDDNYGFAAWASGQDWSRLRPVTSDTTVVYGEWVGRGINAGTSANSIKDRFFAVFAVLYVYGDVEALIVDPADIPNPGFYHILPWSTAPITPDADGAETINMLVEDYETCDPWVAATFGIDGPGEGLVLYALRPNPAGGGGYMPMPRSGDRMIKAKTKAHRHVKTERPVRAPNEVPQDVLAFVDAYVTEARLTQVASLVGRDIRLTGDFLKAFNADVIKESAADLDAADLKWKDVGALVNQRAARWYKDGLGSVG